MEDFSEIDEELSKRGERTASAYLAFLEGILIASQGMDNFIKLRRLFFGPLISKEVVEASK